MLTQSKSGSKPRPCPCTLWVGVDWTWWSWALRGGTLLLTSRNSSYQPCKGLLLTNILSTFLWLLSHLLSWCWLALSFWIGEHANLIPCALQVARVTEVQPGQVIIFELPALLLIAANCGKEAVDKQFQSNVCLSFVLCTKYFILVLFFSQSYFFNLSCAFFLIFFKFKLCNIFSIDSTTQIPYFCLVQGHCRLMFHWIVFYNFVFLIANILLLQHSAFFTQKYFPLPWLFRYVAILDGAIAFLDIVGARCNWEFHNKSKILSHPSPPFIIAIHRDSGDQTDSDSWAQQHCRWNAFID